MPELDRNCKSYDDNFQLPPPNDRATHVHVIARRFALTLPVAATIAQLAGIGADADRVRS
jgi:hypothetical protein